MPSFTDSKGTVWTPRVTVNVMRRFEESTGVGLFEAVFKVFNVDEGKSKAAKKQATLNVLQLCSTLFGKMNAIFTFLYEACVEDKSTITKDEFESRIGKTELNAAMRCALISFMEFFPDAKDTENIEQEEGKLPFPEK